MLFKMISFYFFLRLSKRPESIASSGPPNSPLLLKSPYSALSVEGFQGGEFFSVWYDG